MGARFTSTLVAANLLAVSGLCGLSLVAAFDTLRSGGGREARAESSLPASIADSDYPAHPVRITTRADRSGSFAQGQSLVLTEDEPSPSADPTAVAEPHLAALLEPDAPAVAPPARPADSDAEMARAAERLALIETAAGPRDTGGPIPTRRVGPQEANGALPGPQLANLPRGAAAERSVPIAPTPRPASEAAPSAAARPPALQDHPEYSRPLPPAAIRTSARDTSGQAVTHGYVVIGSFTKLDEAEGHRALYKHLAPRVIPAETKGRLYHRVMVGPFERPALKSAKQRIVAAGIADAWILISPPVPAAAKEAGKDAREQQALPRQARSPLE